MAVPGTRESYIGVFLENIIYGVYLSVLVESCILFERKHQTRNAKHIYLMVTAFLMFILITARCVLDTYRCIAAFDQPGVDFGPPNTKVGLVTNACWFFVTTVGDAFIIFRTYVIWNHNWLVIIIPTLVCLADFASSIWVIVALAQFDPTKQSVFQNIVITSMNTFLALTLVTNLICTGLIAFRIFYLHNKVAGLVSPFSGRSEPLRIVSIIVESAAIYTLLLIGSLISNRLNTYINYIFFNCTPPTIGLVFSYIIIRVSRGTSYGETTGTVATTSLRMGRVRDGSQTFESSHKPDSRSRTEVQIRLERTTQNDSLPDAASPNEEAKITKYPGSAV
ncbi:hypothetical protein C8R43DRAFT_975314 [Mycena crocata]|nr:hypothetical protein C8R43DRAFT_975314 [Mycena crocata]